MNSMHKNKTWAWFVFRRYSLDRFSLILVHRYLCQSNSWLCLCIMATLINRSFFVVKNTSCESCLKMYNFVTNLYCLECLIQYLKRSVKWINYSRESKVCKTNFLFILPKPRFFALLAKKFKKNLRFLGRSLIKSKKSKIFARNARKFKILTSELRYQALPGLTAMVKHDDHTMTWYDHGDSYLPWYDHGKIMAWSSWNIAWACHADKGYYYNVVGQHLLKWISLKISKLPKTRKSCNMFVISKLLCNNNLLFGYYRRKLKITGSILCSVLLTRQLRGVNYSKSSQVCHIMVYDTNYLRRYWQNILIFFEKKHAKHDAHTMIMVWIM